MYFLALGVQSSNPRFSGGYPPVQSLMLNNNKGLTSEFGKNTFSENIFNFFK